MRIPVELVSKNETSKGVLNCICQTKATVECEPDGERNPNHIGVERCIHGGGGTKVFLKKIVYNELLESCEVRSPVNKDLWGRFHGGRHKRDRGVTVVDV